jgi:uncharacterized protein (TIGR03437 family)
MQSRLYFFMAALCVSGSLISAQTVMTTAPGARERLLHARKLRQAAAARQSVMLQRTPGPRVVKPHQVFDNSGNGMLSGAYFVRQVLTLPDENSGAIDQAVSLTGTMTFDGNGNYTFTGQELNSTVGTTAVAYSTSGIYAVSSSGLVQIGTPIDIDNQDIEFGGVGASGEVVASATEGGQYEDIFIAIPEGPASAVQGSYQMGFIDYLGGNASNVRNGYGAMTAVGGSFGNVSVTGAMANQGGVTTSQTLAGVTYSFSGSTGTITFPTASNPLTALVSGVKTFAVSKDGNLLVGGNPNGFDLWVAVRSATSVSNATFVGTYFQGALENTIQSDCSTDCNSMDAFYGSMALNGEGAGTQHLREAVWDIPVFDYTSDVNYGFPSSGVYNDGALFEWMLSANGEALLQVGIAPYYTLIVAFQAQTYSGTGVFLNPIGIVNSASFAPITNSLAPGEYVTLFGSGLGTAAPALSLPLPDTLGGASVTVDSVSAPLLSASPGLLNIFLPNETPPYDLATFGVSVGGSNSNQVTLYTASTAPGVFTSTANGIGPADLFHLNYTYVTAANPAVAGETLFFYSTGLGMTTPVVPDGAAAPSSPLAQVYDPNLEVDIFDSSGNDTTVTIASAALVPTLAGVYQINFMVPSGLASGEGYLDVGTTDGFTSEAKIFIQ